MSTPPTRAQKTDATPTTKRFVFVLLDRFTMMSFSCAIEPLRLANYVAGKPLYDWILAGEGGVEATCSNGATFKLDIGLEDVDREDTILVCGGIDIQRATTKPVLNWLRREARRGNTMTKSVFVMDGNRLTTAGGISSIDLVLKIIAADHGQDLANTVADLLIYSAIRTDQDTQRLSIPTRIGVRHPKLSQVIQMMEGNIEDPLSPADLADQVDMAGQGAQPADADRYERDQRGTGLRLCQPVAFFQMLPQPLQHHPLPRTWVTRPDAADPAVDLRTGPCARARSGPPHPT